MSIQVGEQQSPSVVFCSATVIGEEAHGEGVQQLLQMIVIYSVQYSQRYDCKFCVPTHFQNIV